MQSASATALPAIDYPATMPERYDEIGRGYPSRRRSDPRIAAAIDRAIGGARSILNVGAGTGSYEPMGPGVAAVEPSPVMIAQRPPGRAPVLRARAERLPFRDQSFDATLAVLTVHHWSDPLVGLGELARVSRRQVIFTFDPERQRELWLARDYLPMCADFEQSRAPTMDAMLRSLPSTHVVEIAIPHDCIDGFLGAYWRRPEMYLDASVRAGISTLAQLPRAEVEPALELLARDLKSGKWNERYAGLLGLDELDLGYRLIVSGE